MMLCAIGCFNCGLLAIKAAGNQDKGDFWFYETNAAHTEDSES